MNRIGLIGGTTWLSTAEYYRNINLLVNERLGGNDFAEITLESLNFGELQRNIAANVSVEQFFVDAAKRLASGGAKAIAICANTPHIYAEQIKKATGLPLIHIAEATAQEVKRAGINKVALLGTGILMGSDIYPSALGKLDIECVIPEEDHRTFIHASIFNELAKSQFTDELRATYLEIIDRQCARGAQGVILGCTEIPLLLTAGQIPMPSFDTAAIHSRAIVDFMLKES